MKALKQIRNRNRMGNKMRARLNEAIYKRGLEDGFVSGRKYEKKVEK